MHEEELKLFHAQVSSELRARYPSGTAGLEVLSNVLSQLRTTEIPLHESPFLSVLAETDAAYSSALCGALVARPTSSLAGAFHVFLNAIDAAGPGTALRH